jgi:hypothetical protein
MRGAPLLLGLMLSAGLLAAACGEDMGEGADAESGDEPEMVREDLPDPPEGGARLVSPTFSVAPGAEAFTCMRIPFDADEDLFVNASNSYQVTGGHHTMLFYVDGTVPLDDEPHECNDQDMTSIRLVGVGSADGSGIGLPDGMALRLPAGARLYAQSHYLNATDGDITAQDVIDLELLPADEVEQVAGTFAQVDLGLELPAGEKVTRTIECTAPLEMKVPWMLPHMHEFGAHFTLEAIIDGEARTLYDSEWTAALRDHFPILDQQPHLEFTGADTIRTTCTWDNTSADRLLFPREMCATFMAFYPSPDGALLACDETGRHFEP